MLIAFAFRYGLAAGCVLPYGSLGFQRANTHYARCLSGGMMVLVIFSLRVFRRPIVFLFNQRVIRVGLTLCFEALRFCELLRPFEGSFSYYGPRPSNDKEWFFFFGAFCGPPTVVRICLVNMFRVLLCKYMVCVGYVEEMVVIIDRPCGRVVGLFLILLQGSVGFFREFRHLFPFSVSSIRGKW